MRTFLLLCIVAGCIAASFLLDQGDFMATNKPAHQSLAASRQNPSAKPPAVAPSQAVDKPKSKRRKVSAAAEGEAGLIPSPDRTVAVDPNAFVDEQAAIREMMRQYYAAMRDGDYQKAKTFYEQDAFKDLPEGTAEKAMSAFMEISGGMPEPEPELMALGVTGDTAHAEEVIQREGIGPVYMVLVDEQGHKLGTWCRTLYFVKQEGFWKLASTGNEGLSAISPQFLQEMKMTVKQISKRDNKRQQ